MTPSKILFCLCVSFVSGIFFASVFKIPQALIWVFLLVGILLTIFSFINNKLLIVGFCVLVLCIGILRCQISLFGIQENNLIKLNDREESMTLAGKIVAEPDNRDKIQRLKFRPDNFDGLVLITKNRYPEYNYLDKIKITGKLKTPDNFGDFDYKKYLLKDGVYSVMDFPKTELLQKPGIRSPASAIFEGILWAKQKIRESIRQNYSPPGSLVMEGTILGDSGALSAELKSQLNTTGLRHIIAVSGTHIVILSAILLNLFLLIGLWRGQAFWGSIVLIWLYILLSGLPASGIRAGIMVTFFLVAQKFGREAGGLRVIFIAGSLILIANPLLLFYDIGFQLSFLAVLGLIYLDSFIKSFVVKFLKNENFSGMVSATLSAQIFTIPIMLYNFGNISLIAPVTNILVLPVVEPLMIFGFLSSIAGVFSGWLGFILSIPCQILLVYFVKVLELFSAPWAMKVFENVHWAWLVILYFMIGVFVAWVKKKERQNKFY